jgi:GNAT superfamily N-acetyltransferase
VKIIIAGLEHLQVASGLFNQYRMFYQQPSNLEGATQFIQERLQKNDSTILLAQENETVMGFTQLYPSFSSVSMKPIWILNDLFVEEAYRKQGVAQQLMTEAEAFARETGAIRVTLSTQISNAVARSLYESCGYVRDEEFYHYTLSL